MRYGVEPDVDFLVDALLGLAYLNARQARENPEMAVSVLRRMLNGEYVWHEETPDVWSDLISFAGKRKFFDCEDFVAVIAALAALCRFIVWVGIQRVGPYRCHAILSINNIVYDPSRLFKMPGTGQGPVVWRKVETEQMPVAESLSLITAGIQKLRTMMTPEETPGPAETSTGGSCEADIKAVRFERDMFRNRDRETRAKLQKAEGELSAARERVEAARNELKACSARANELAGREKAVSAELKKSEARERVANANAASTKTALASLDAEVKQLRDKNAELAQASAFLEACKNQLQELQSKSKDDERVALASEALQQLSEQRAESLADAFADPYTATELWGLIGTGAAHLAALPCCDSCAIGGECEGGCPEHGEPINFGLDSAFGDVQVSTINGCSVCPG